MDIPRWTRRDALVASLAGLFARPAHAQTAKTARVRRGYTDGRFGQIHYRVAGPDGAPDRTPLVCLHSSPRSGKSYERFIAAMGTDRIAIAPDTPGFGDSDPPESPPAIEDYANAILDLIAQFGLDSVDLIGYHTGSMVAVALALAEPRLVRRVVMVSAPMFTEEEIPERRKVYGPVELTSDGSHLARRWRRLVEWAMPGVTLEHIAEQFPDIVRRPDISWWGHNAAYGYRLAERLPDVRQPVLLLNPDDDLYDRTLRARGLLANGEVRHLPGWGTGFLDAKTAEAAELVREFLDGAPRQS